MKRTTFHVENCRHHILRFFCFLCFLCFLCLLCFQIAILFPLTAEAGPRYEKLKPFFTDGCTDFVDGPPGQPNLWLHCCTEHDLRYWFGGTEKEMNFTDRRLKSCVQKVAGPIWSNMIYDGVRLGHLSPIKSKTHWGWGWTPARRNLPLTDLEVNYVELELRQLPLRTEYLNHFIQTYLVEHRSK